MVYSSNITRFTGPRLQGLQFQHYTVYSSSITRFTGPTLQGLQVQHYKVYRFKETRFVSAVTCQNTQYCRVKYTIKAYDV